MISTVAQYSFVAGGDGLAHLGPGWGTPEPGGVWSQLGHASLNLPAAGGSGALLLEFTLDPQQQPAVIRHRMVTISINGAPAGRRRVGGEICWRMAVPHAAASAPITIGIGVSSPDPADTKCVKLVAITMLRDRQTAPPPPVRPCAFFRFGWNEATEALLGPGWGTPEDAYVWAIGGHSVLDLPVPPDGAPRLALLDMRPFLRPPNIIVQRVLVRAGGAPPQALALHDRVVLAVPLWPAAGQDRVTLRFNNLDADFETTDPLYHFGKPFAWMLASIRVVPALPHFLPSARPRVPGSLADGSMATYLAALTGLAAADIAGSFEGLGNGCELGLLQRDLDREQMGLLRFAGIRQRELVEGLFSGFLDVAREDRMQWAVRRQEDDTWRLIEETYGLSSATPYDRTQPPPVEGFRRAAQRLPRLAERLMADVAGATKIFVLRMSEPGGGDTQPAAALSVLAALRHYGEADMIWLVIDGDRPAGSAERLACGLIRGHLESPQTGRPVSPDTMMSAIANALVLLRQGARLPPAPAHAALAATRSPLR